MLGADSFLKRCWGRIAGRPLTSARAIARGDAARGRKDWLPAAGFYRLAVAYDPSLRAIWVQLGHALKEAGDFSASRDAYLRAKALAGDDGDPDLHLGHLSKVEGNLLQAKHHYRQSLAENPGQVDARSELLTLAKDWHLVSSRASSAALAHRAREQLRVGEFLEPNEAAPDRRAHGMIFDASDLVSYFQNARLPTGIQRVQIEVVSTALKSGGCSQVCCFSDAGKSWTRIPSSLFIELCELAISGGDLLDPAWLDILEDLYASIDLADPVAFRQGDFLINLGTSWWLQNYFLYVRDAKTKHGIYYVPFVHDFIPIIAPEHCIKELTQDFISWVSGVFSHADFYLVNSNATKADLMDVARRLGHHIDSDLISVVRLDADFRREGRQSLAPAELSRWNLVRAGYVLFVSTIESRKNHVLAFEAWIALLTRYGTASIPKLVCVGNPGWLNDAVYKMLETYPVLRGKVVMLSRMSDQELDLLYQNCLFALYPSQYEGWGLPVTESLCYGRVPLISDASSLPEAGGEFAVYFRSNDRLDLMAKLDRLIFDDEFRQRCELRIVEGFEPRSWLEIAEEIREHIERFVDRGGNHAQLPSPVVIPGLLYPLHRNMETRIRRDLDSGEAYRSGLGWWALEDWGCWTRPEGGRLRFELLGAPELITLWLRLHSPGRQTCPFEIRLSNETVSGTLEVDETRWVAISARLSTATADATIHGMTSVDLGTTTHGRDRRVVSVGISALGVELPSPTDPSKPAQNPFVSPET